MEDSDEDSVDEPPQLHAPARNLEEPMSPPSKKPEAKSPEAKCLNPVMSSQEEEQLRNIPDAQLDSTETQLDPPNSPAVTVEPSTSQKSPLNLVHEVKKDQPLLGNMEPSCLDENHEGYLFAQSQRHVSNIPRV